MDKGILGADAEGILSNPAFQKAEAYVEAAIIRQLKALPIDGKPETDRRRLELNVALRMADYYRSALREMVANGKLEEHSFDKKKRFRVL